MSIVKTSFVGEKSSTNKLRRCISDREKVLGYQINEHITVLQFLFAINLLVDRVHTNVQERVKCLIVKSFVKIRSKNLVRFGIYLVFLAILINISWEIFLWYQSVHFCEGVIYPLL